MQGILVIKYEFSWAWGGIQNALIGIWNTDRFF